MLLAGGDGVDDGATPEVALLESIDVEPGDDTEVIGAAFQGTEEVGVGILVGVDDGAIGEDDFVVKDIVADEAVAGGEE